MYENIPNFMQGQTTTNKTIASGILCIICLMQLFASCTTGSETSEKWENNAKQTAVEKNRVKYEWFEYVDSVQTIRMDKCIDSFSMYTMKETAPEVISRNQFIFWKKGEIAVQGEYDFISHFGDSLIQVVSYGKSNVVVINYDVSHQNLPKPVTEKVFDLEKDPYSGNCYEITKIKKDHTNKQLTIELYNSCFNRYVEKKVAISITNGSLH